MRIAVIFHCFYFDLIDEFLVYFSKIGMPFSLFVTMPSDVYTKEEFDGAYKKITESYPDAVVISCRNYGADIYPCFCVMDYITRKNLHFDKYVKVHTKKSLRKKDKGIGERWRKDLCDAIFNNFQSNLELEGIISSLKQSHSFVKDTPKFRRDFMNPVFNFYGYSLVDVPKDLMTSCGTMFMIDGYIWEDFFTRSQKLQVSQEYFFSRKVCISFERLWHILPIFYKKPINFV